MTTQLGEMMTASVEENIGAESLGLNEEGIYLEWFDERVPELFGLEKFKKAFKVCVEAHSDSGHGPLLLDCVGTQLKFCAN